MALPKYAQGVQKSQLVQITCRGKCKMGRYAIVLDNGNNDFGTKITSNTYAECLKCGYKASAPSNWQKA